MRLHLSVMATVIWILPQLAHAQAVVPFGSDDAAAASGDFDLQQDYSGVGAIIVTDTVYGLSPEEFRSQISGIPVTEIDPEAEAAESETAE